MLPVERVLAVLRHQEPDRVPHFEWVHSQNVITQLTNGGDYYNLIELLDIDGVMVAPAYRKTRLDNDLLLDEWGCTRRTGHDDYAMTVDEFAPIKNHADLENWRIPDPDDPYRYEPIKKAVERFGGKRAIILQMRDVWSGVRDYMGYQQALMGMMDSPDLVEEIITRCVSHYTRVIQRAAEMGVNVVFSGDDIATVRGPLFSPRIWKKLFLPHYKKLVNVIHDAGLYHWKHSDGNMYPFLDSIVEAGTDGIDPIDPMGGMELTVVKEKYGDRVAIKGNVDQVNLLINGTKQEVVESVKACILAAGQGGGYVCSSSNSIHSGVNPELYRVMVETIHEYGTYPLAIDRLRP